MTTDRAEGSVDVPMGMATEHVVSCSSDKRNDWYSPLVNVKSEITAEDVQVLAEPNSYQENSRERESKLREAKALACCTTLHPQHLKQVFADGRFSINMC